MENTNPNSQLYDRKVKYCQFRLQQAIILQDDEITRISERLNQTKAMILEANQKIENLNQKISQEILNKQGESRMRTTDFNVTIARIKTSHHQALQDLQKQQAQEIELIQQDFNNSLNTLKQTAKSRNSKHLEDIDYEIQKVTKQIQLYKEETENVKQKSVVVQNEPTISAENFNFGVIDQLQQVIKTRNDERYQNLSQSKQKLAQCVETLETMMRNHTVRVNQIQEQFKQLDFQYQTECKQLEEKQGSKIQVLKSQLGEAQKRTNRLLNALKRLDYENQKQLKDTMKDLDAMKQQYMTFAENLPDNNEAQMEELKALRVKVPQMQKNLSRLDQTLMEKRTENENLKRQIGQCKHMIRFSGTPY